MYDCLVSAVSNPILYNPLENHIFDPLQVYRYHRFGIYFLDNYRLPKVLKMKKKEVASPRGIGLNNKNVHDSRLLMINQMRVRYTLPLYTILPIGIFVHACLYRPSEVADDFKWNIIIGTSTYIFIFGTVYIRFN